MDKPTIIPLTIPLVTRNQILYSETLFEHGDEVFIQHHCEQYSLRRTSNDRLIFTK